MRFPPPLVGMIGPVLMGLGVVALGPHEQDAPPPPAAEVPVIAAGHEDGATGRVETYLSSEPGQSIRLTRIDADTAYVEHIDLASGRITWSGELTIGAGRP